MHSNIAFVEWLPQKGTATCCMRVCAARSEVSSALPEGLAYAVHIVLKGAGQVQIDYVTNALYVQPPAGHICGHEDLQIRQVRLSHERASA